MPGRCKPSTSHSSSFTSDITSYEGSGTASLTGFWRRRRRVQLGAKGEQQRLVVRERHAVGLRRVPPDLGDERVLVLGASFEPAVAMNDLVHDSSRRG
jgi:hypothetical protein